MHSSLQQYITLGCNRDSQLPFTNTSDKNICVNKDSLLVFIKNKILKRSKICDLTEKNQIQTVNDIIKYGIYSDLTVSKLLKNGIPKESVVKAMKYGLQNISRDVLQYFYIFNITPETLNCWNLLLSDVNEELLTKLNEIGFSELESLKIILTGLANQSEHCLFQLSTKGVVTTKILNYEGSIICPTQVMIKFLEKLGLDDVTLQLVKDKGINEEIQQILYNLGCFEEDNESIQKNLSLGTSYDSSSKKRCTCSCSCSDDSKISDMNYNYFRENLMVPIVWAMSKTLKYKPTDPLHYLACQLVRWSNGNADPTEVNKAVKFLAANNALH